jgi:hypothetical protein
VNSGSCRIEIREYLVLNEIKTYVSVYERVWISGRFYRVGELSDLTLG